MIRLLLIGAGGHCRSVIDVIQMTTKYEIVGIIGLHTEVGNTICGIEVVGDDGDIAHWAAQVDQVLVTIGQIGKSQIRTSIFNRLIDSHIEPATIVSPLSHVSTHANIAGGTIIMHHAIINAGAQIGENCIINSKALIEHDVEIGAHSHIATRATVNGGTRIGCGSFIGSGAIIYQMVTLVDQSIVRAGDIIRG